MPLGSYGNEGACRFFNLRKSLLREIRVRFHFIDLLCVAVAVCRDKKIKLVGVNPAER